MYVMGDGRSVGQEVCQGVTKGGFVGCGDAHALEIIIIIIIIIIIVSRIAIEEEGRQDSRNSATTEAVHAAALDTPRNDRRRGKKKNARGRIHLLLRLCCFELHTQPRTRGRGNQGRSRSGRLVSSRLRGAKHAIHWLSTSQIRFMLSGWGNPLMEKYPERLP